jgi:hypothetical protein
MALSLTPSAADLQDAVHEKIVTDPENTSTQTKNKR